MIEMHSHVLPGMDDGARNTEEATELLKALRKQGISSVVLTPHFYPNRQTLEDFVEQRAGSFAALNEAIKRQEAYETPPEAGAPFEAGPPSQPKIAASPAIETLIESSAALGSDLSPGAEIPPDPGPLPQPKIAASPAIETLVESSAALGPDLSLRAETPLDLGPPSQPKTAASPASETPAEAGTAPEAIAPPALILASEVLLSDRIMSYDNIEDLCIAGTPYLLLELPYTAEWGMAVFRLVDQMIAKFGIVPIMAHVERYEPVLRKPERTLNELVELGCLLQMNIECLIDRRTHRLGVKLIKKGYIDLVASDCHDMTYRPPRYPEFYEALKKYRLEHHLKGWNKTAAEILSLAGRPPGSPSGSPPGDPPGISPGNLSKGAY